MIGWRGVKPGEKQKRKNPVDGKIPFLKSV